MAELQNDGLTSGTERAAGISRRNLVAATVAGGVGLGTVPTQAAGAAERVSRADHVGGGRQGSTPVELRGRIRQSGDSGQTFDAYGYLTRVAGTSRGQIFDGTPLDESTALLTITAAGELTARILDMNVHSLDIVGTMQVHQRRHGGADFDAPGSFAQGPVVARFDLRLQDVLAVYAAGSGIPTLTGDMTQTAAGALGGPLAGKMFGSRGASSRLFATGLGTLTDPVTLNALLEIAGSWSLT
jgi:hypothetical protein